VATGLELVHVRKGRGRIHLTPIVPSEGPVHTLCGKELEGGVEVTQEDADCQLCLRRQDDPAVVSSAFFRDDEGSRLLELSLEAATRRREGRPDLKVVPSPPEPTGSRPVAPATRGRESEPHAGAEPQAAPAPRGELDLTGMRLFSEDVYLTPGGVIVRMQGGRIAEVVTEARAQLTRTREGWRARLGDLVLEERDGIVTAKIDRL
jgi:hypothetical protein